VNWANLWEVDLLALCSSCPRVQRSSSHLCSRRYRLHCNPVYLPSLVRSKTVFRNASFETSFVFWFHPNGSTIAPTGVLDWMTKRSENFNFLPTMERFCKGNLLAAEETWTSCSNIDFSGFETGCFKYGRRKLLVNLSQNDCLFSHQCSMKVFHVKLSLLLCSSP